MSLPHRQKAHDSHHFFLRFQSLLQHWQASHSGGIVSCVNHEYHSDGTSTFDRYLFVPASAVTETGTVEKSGVSHVLSAGVGGSLLSAEKKGDKGGVRL